MIVFEAVCLPFVFVVECNAKVLRERSFAQQVFE